MGFEERVNRTRGLAGAFCRGLQGLGTNSHYVDVSGAPKGTIQGSVDIDTALAHIFPSDPRWDYAIFQATATQSPREHIHFVEVHPASGGGNVDEIIRKATWLRQWLQADGQPLQKYSRSLVWVGTGRVSPHVTRQTRLLAQKGIRPPTARYTIRDVPA